MSLRLNVQTALKNRIEAALGAEGLPANVTAAPGEDESLPYQGIGEDSRGKGIFSTGTSNDDTITHTVRCWDDDGARVKRSADAITDNLQAAELSVSGYHIVLQKQEGSAEAIPYPRPGRRMHFQVPLRFKFEIEHL